MASDFVKELSERVAQAAAGKRALRIRGGGSKDFYGGAATGEVLEVGGYTGIVAYEPKELVLTVRAGTPLAEVERALAAERQMLPFEPPHFAGEGDSRATIGAPQNAPMSAGATITTRPIAVLSGALPCTNASRAGHSASVPQVRRA